jgi:hypothetical protein
MSPFDRIPPEEAFEQMENGEALLVCAYADEEKCRAAHIENALTLQDLERLAPPRDRALIFYCA